MLLAKKRFPLSAARTEILFQTPKGTDFYLLGFSANFIRTVVAGAQTSRDLGFALTAANWPIAPVGGADSDIPMNMGMETTPAGAAYIRGMAPQPHKCPPLSIITMVVTGWAAGLPPWVSITLQGRTGFLTVG